MATFLWSSCSRDVACHIVVERPPGERVLIRVDSDGTLEISVEIESESKRAAQIALRSGDMS
jgi:hypothetical protein